MAYRKVHSKSNWCDGAPAFVYLCTIIHDCIGLIESLCCIQSQVAFGSYLRPTNCNNNNNSDKYKPPAVWCVHVYVLMFVIVYVWNTAGDRMERWACNMECTRQPSTTWASEQAGMHVHSFDIHVYMYVDMHADMYVYAACVCVCVHLCDAGNKHNASECVFATMTTAATRAKTVTATAPRSAACATIYDSSHLA